MGLAEIMRNSELRAKELSNLLAKKISSESELLDSLRDEIDLLDDVEKGIVMEALESVTDVDPDIIEPVFDVVVYCLRCEAPKVKWEAARVIGNIAHRFPSKAASSASRLLENARHKGTVVRWSAAYALGEIVKHDLKSRKKLMPEIESILKREKNNGVKNVYRKAISAIKV